MEAIVCAGLLGLAGHYLQNKKTPVSQRERHDLYKKYVAECG